MSSAPGENLPPPIEGASSMQSSTPSSKAIRLSKSAAGAFFHLHAEKYGMKPEWSGRTIVIERRLYRVIGLLAITSYSNVLVEHVSEKSLHKVPPFAVIRSMAIQAGG
jgi:hypothetical protein